MSAIDLLRIGLLIAFILLAVCAIVEFVKIRIEDRREKGGELIRCKDCKWFGDFGCAIRVVDDTDKPTENDFCSFAERREE